MYTEVVKPSDRRQFPRTPMRHAVVVTTPTFFGRYELRNLSAGGALLSGVPLLELGTMVELILQLPACPTMRVEAEVIHHVDTLDGKLSMGLIFYHENDVAQDQIQSALLAELEATAGSRPAQA